MLKKIAESRGLPLSTYIKFVMTEELKKDPIWNSLESIESQTELIDKYINDLKGDPKKSKKPTKKKK